MAEANSSAASPHAANATPDSGPQLPAECVCCGRPATLAIPVRLIRVRGRVRAFGPPISIHLRPTPTRPHMYLAYCTKHRTLRLVWAMAVFYLGNILGLSLWALIVFP